MTIANDLASGSQLHGAGILASSCKCIDSPSCLPEFKMLTGVRLEQGFCPHMNVVLA